MFHANRLFSLRHLISLTQSLTELEEEVLQIKRAVNTIKENSYPPISVLDKYLGPDGCINMDLYLGLKFSFCGSIFCSHV